MHLTNTGHHIYENVKFRCCFNPFQLSMSCFVKYLLVPAVHPSVPAGYKHNINRSCVLWPSVSLQGKSHQWSVTLKLGGRGAMQHYHKHTSSVQELPLLYSGWRKLHIPETITRKIAKYAISVLYTTIFFWTKQIAPLHSCLFSLRTHIWQVYGFILCT